MKWAPFLLLFGCGQSDAHLLASVHLPSALRAAELRELVIRAVDDDELASLSITPTDLCIRYTQRDSVPDLQNVYRQAYPFASGVTSGDKRTLDGLPPRKSYTLLVSAADQVETQNASGVFVLPAGSKSGRGCTPSNQVAAGQTTKVTACLYFQDAAGQNQGPPVSPDCPAPN